MSRFEDMLNNKKLEIEKLEVPDELEERLRCALEKAQPKRKSKFRFMLKAASLIIVILLIGYNSDTLAFYGKKIIGFDEVMTDTLKGLNNLGKGQIIDKSYTFKNGVKITLDGIMLDDNQLLMFYTIKDPKGKIDKQELNIQVNSYLKGIVGTYDIKGGTGKKNSENTETKWTVEAEKPYFFEKSLEWEFALVEGNRREEGKILFTLDRSKAMGSSLRKKLNSSIKIDQGNIKFKSITASPTTTYIEGEVQDIFNMVKDEISGERFRPIDMDIRLIANGKEVEPQGSGISTGMKGITFENNFDALPKDLKSLQIKLVSLKTNNKVNERLELSKNNHKKLEVLGQEININNVYEKEGKTYVTITTKEDVILSKVYMIIDGKKAELKYTVSNNLDKKSDGTISYTRTLCFERSGEELILEINGIAYNKVYNQIIDVEI
ncbi:MULTISPECIES: DUF4179 domain-containing protein [Clostridium]|uniref:DUF4179 domain-containing protein n=2 Tax=Clostridium TaxID=1485 RepID=A0A151AKM5_9CLOT|nr:MULTISPECIES: DUF4179 domain-containing protein [Clostridium]KYH28080.1 hypothetical protein CLCOL_22140 [Clostridium colicanis DSM 13634]PRR71574.1 hypothetical protein CPAL_17190 [Clostridium thermopalmarium DSM 5974]PVZ20961.1 uncharacterized protein DUF4179 [Clostridium thermopalmarium DSM 5974]